MSYRVRSGVLAIAFLVAGIGLSVLYWTWDRSYYAAFAREGHLAEQVFHAPGGGDQHINVEVLDGTDDALRAMVLCSCGEPSFPAQVYLSSRELAHLRDVAAIYRVLTPLAALATVVTLLVAGRVSRRTVRRVALGQAGLVAGVGVVAALAFDPAFRLFHEVLFPQGNFLFDPATDNLVLLYPESYWLGVTIRVGATFLLVVLAVAGLASLPIRFAADRAGGRAVPE